MGEKAVRVRAPLLKMPRVGERQSDAARCKGYEDFSPPLDDCGFREHHPGFRGLDGRAGSCCRRNFGRTNRSAFDASARSSLHTSPEAPRNASATAASAESSSRAAASSADTDAES